MEWRAILDSSQVPLSSVFVRMPCVLAQYGQERAGVNRRNVEKEKDKWAQLWEVITKRESYHWTIEPVMIDHGPYHILLRGSVISV